MEGKVRRRGLAAPGRIDREAGLEHGPVLPSRSFPRKRESGGFPHQYRGCFGAGFCGKISPPFFSTSEFRVKRNSGPLCLILALCPWPYFITRTVAAPKHSFEKP